jgi:1-acyl-sn-glycerol-3-phosphate acyltransferase
MTLLRSFLFMTWFLAATVVLAIGALPILALPRRRGRPAAAGLGRVWARATLWGLQRFARIGMRVVGNVPEGPVLVAAKHMSMWDTLALHLLLQDPAIVLKRELLRIPFYGWYLAKAGAIAIDRGGAASALRRMQQAGKKALAEGRPILIFPEGTRKKPGAAPDYKPGVAGLYSLLGVTCVPVALDSGVYWTGFAKKPGTITVQFLAPIPPGLKRQEFMARLESGIETSTQRLIAG